MVATTLVRGRFTLAELSDEAVRDPDSAFPAAYSGWLEVTTTARVLDAVLSLGDDTPARAFAEACTA